MAARSKRALLRTAVVLAVLVCLTLTLGATEARADCQGAATVTASALNVRSQASTASSVVTCLPRGTVVLVTGSSTGWYQVWYQGSSGYVSADYVTYSTSADASFGTGTVNGTGVNVRSGPGTGYSVVGTVTNGNTLPVVGVSGSWYKVTYNGSSAYISGSYLSLSGGSGSSTSSPSPAPAGGTASGTGTINGNYVRMRSGPGTGYSILGTYNKGSVMTVTGTSGDWYAVTSGSLKGYVYKQYLTMSSSGSGAATGGSTGSFTVTTMNDTPAVTTAAVNMRSGPATTYTSQRVLAQGTAITLTGTSGSWYRISYNGSTGYVSGSYVSTNVATGSSSTAAGERIVNEAKKYLGVPYVYGGTSPSGFDCSGLVYYVYKQCGYSITRTATAQNSDGRYVARSNLQPGDIIIFYNGYKSAIGHAGIYIGNNQFIHASSGGGRVMISGLSETYYNTRFYSARRVVS